MNIVWNQFKNRNFIVFLLLTGALAYLYFFSNFLMLLISKQKENTDFDLLNVCISPRDRFYGAASPEGGILWVVGKGGKIILSNDDGAKWECQPVPVQKDLMDIETWSRKEAVVVGEDGLILLTRDGGKKWEKAASPVTPNRLLRVRIMEDGSVWSVGQMGNIVVSLDKGKTWKRTRDPEDVTWYDVNLVDLNHCVVVGEFGKILRGVRTGIDHWKWQKVPTTIDQSLKAVNFRDGSHGVAVGLEGLVIMTFDAGQTWRVHKSGTIEHLYDVLWDGKEWLAVGGGGVIVRITPNAGEIQARNLGKYSWHTKIVKRNKENDDFFLVGANMGKWKGDKWTPFK